MWADHTPHEFGVEPDIDRLLPFNCLLKRMWLFATYLHVRVLEPRSPARRPFEVTDLAFQRRAFAIICDHNDSTARASVKRMMKLRRTSYHVSLPACWLNYRLPVNMMDAWCVAVGKLLLTLASLETRSDLVLNSLRTSFYHGSKSEPMNLCIYNLVGCFFASAEPLAAIPTNGAGSSISLRGPFQTRHQSTVPSLWDCVLSR